MKKKVAQKQTQISLSQKQMSHKKVWVFRLISMIVVPLVLFVFLELVLRVSGFGYSTDIATQQKVGGTNLYCYNTKLGWQFFPPRMARDLAGFAFETEKSPQTYRIFVLGASAAQGIPDEHYNFGRFLEIMLEHEYPRTDFEVINVAMTAINSHAVYQIAKSCARFEPDLMIVYLGNNEVVGPYGAGTIFAPLSPSLTMIRANAAMTSTRTGQLLKSLLSIAGSNSKVPQSWGGLEMFLDEQVRPEADALEVVYSHFEQNLRDICNVGIKAGANVLVSNVGCNLKDSAPFASLHRDGLMDSEKKAWAEHYAEGMSQETAGELEEAVANYLAAEQIDGTFADLQFRLGRCFWHLEQYPEAKERYLQAREYDTLRFRADAKINQVIQSVSQGREPEGIYFVDAVKALEANSPHNTPGNELFYEHVHYRFEGNYILAKTMFEQVKKTLPETITQHKKDLPTLTLDGCQDRLVYTVFERYKSASYVLDGLISKPPFTSQSYHGDLVQELENEVNNSKQGTISDAKEIAALYNTMISRHRQDWRLRWKLAVLYCEDPAAYEYACIELKKILQNLPYDRAYHALTQILINQNKLDEAESYGGELLKMKPTYADAYANLGNIFRIKGEYKKAIKYLSRAIDLQPEGPLDKYGYLAEIFDKTENPEKAIKVLYKAIENLPKDQTAMAHINLGLLLAKEGRTEEAIQILRTAIRDFPPEKIEKEDDLFVLLIQLDQIELALELYRQKLKVKPDSIAILNNLAWIQATSDDEKIRNANEAVELAEKACVLTKYTSTETLDTLATAYAAKGDFAAAVKTTEKTIRLAIAKGDNALVKELKGRLELYKNEKAYLDPFLSD